jgi:hypothetical protein
LIFKLRDRIKAYRVRRSRLSHAKQVVSVIAANVDDSLTANISGGPDGAIPF